MFAIFETTTFTPTSVTTPADLKRSCDGCRRMKIKVFAAQGTILTFLTKPLVQDIAFLGKPSIEIKDHLQ
jgi:hypothetical protein